MNVLLVTPLVPDPTAASAGRAVMFGILRELEKEHQVVLVTCAAPDPADRRALARLSERGIEVHPLEHRKEAVLARRVRLAVRWLAGAEPLRTLKLAHPGLDETVRAVARTRRIDLVQVEDASLGMLALPSGLPRVLTEHEVLPERAPRTAPDATGLANRFRERDRERRRRRQAEAWARFDRVQVFTELDAEHAQRRAPAVAPLLRTNPFGVDPWPTPAVPIRPSSLLFVGDFRHPPNVDAARWLVRDILPRVLARRPATLFVVGGHPPRSLRALAGPAVTITGRVDDLRPYLERAAVVVAPLREGGGLRLKVLEALAAGKAVVATPLAAAGAVPEHGDPVLELAADTESFAQSILALLGEEATRRRLGARAQAWVREHRSWDAFGERLRAIHAELGVAAGAQRRATGAAS